MLRYSRLSKAISLGCCLGMFALSSLVVRGVESADEVHDEESRSVPSVDNGNAEETPQGLLPSDLSSLTILKNHGVSIGAEATPIRTVRASGTFHYARERKTFELVETESHARSLTLTWRYLGRVYQDRSVSLPGQMADGSDSKVWREIEKETIARDGDRSWERVFFEWSEGGVMRHREINGRTVISEGRQLRMPPMAEEESAVIAGGYGEIGPGFFAEFFLLRQPFWAAEFYGIGFSYEGAFKVLGQEAHVVRFGASSSFTFTRDRFLLIKWGRLGGTERQPVSFEYVCTHFRRWGDVLLPSEIAVTAGLTPLGRYVFDEVEVNASVPADLFVLPLTSLGLR